MNRNDSYRRVIGHMDAPMLRDEYRRTRAAAIRIFNDYLGHYRRGQQPFEAVNFDDKVYDLMAWRWNIRKPTPQDWCAGADELLNDICQENMDIILDDDYYDYYEYD
jgi:hypothetical protein